MHDKMTIIKTNGLNMSDCCTNYANHLRLYQASGGDFALLKR
jgi:hypothetical protein